MSAFVSPILLYTGCAIGAIGVALAMPREKLNPFIIGGLIAAGAFGLVVLVLGLTYPDHIPNYHFYIFSAIALFGALRVITHPRPVYAAMYFVLTIIASSGLYLILSAEFMAFALIIVYAGAILITYLFVIMLATEGPTEDQPDALQEYDRVSREPWTASIAGFILLAGLTSLFAMGTSTLKPDPAMAAPAGRIAVMTKKVEPALRDAGLLKEGEKVARVKTPAGGENLAIDVKAGTITINTADGKTRTIERSQWPKALALTNTEGVAFALIEEHPGSIEIAGVILLMAMLGAVVLARKKVEMDDAAKAAAAQRERSPNRGSDELGVDGQFVNPGVGEGGAPV